MKIVLRITGNIPAKKNNKMMARGRLFTNPDYQRRIKQIEDSFVSQLKCFWPINAGETSTVSYQPCSIASWLPEDDAWTHIPELAITGQLCEKGNEGAEITIEEI